MPLRDAHLYNKNNTPGYHYFTEIRVPGRYLNPSTGAFNEVVERQNRWFYQEDGLPARARPAKKHLESQDIPLSFAVPVNRQGYKGYPKEEHEEVEHYEVYIYHPFRIPTKAKISHNKTTF